MNYLSRGNVIVSNFFEDSISIVDTIEGKEVKKYHLNERGNFYPPLHFGPHHIALDGNLRYLYIPNSHNNTLSIVDLILLRTIDNISVGSCPTQVVLCKKYNGIYVANADSNSVSRIGLDTFSLNYQIPTGELPHGMVISRDQEKIYVANTQSQTITEILTKTNEKRECHKVDCSPWHLDLSYDGKYLFVVNYCSSYQQKGKILMYQMPDMVLVKIIQIGKMPVEVASDQNTERLYIADSDRDEVYVYNLKEDRLEASIEVSRMPHGLKLDYHRKILYATSIKDNRLDVIDIEKMGLIKSVDVGSEPTSILIL